ASCLPIRPRGRGGHVDQLRARVVADLYRTGLPRGALALEEQIVVGRRGGERDEGDVGFLIGTEDGPVPDRNRSAAGGLGQSVAPHGEPGEGAGPWAPERRIR